MFISIVCIQLLAIFILLKHKNNNVPDVFTIKNKYYQYPNIGNLSSFYELKEGIGKITDLTNVPSWLRQAPTYHINTDGLNEETDYAVEKPEDTFRIITLGDSFTFGLFVNTADSWPRKLQKLLSANNCYKKVEVINLGLGGYDAKYEAERFVDKGLKYHPDLVLWLVKDEDFLWINEQMNPLLLKYEHELVPKNEWNNTESPLWARVLKSAQNDYLAQVSFSSIGRSGDSSLSQVSSIYKGPVVLLNLPEYSTDKRVQKLLVNFVASHKKWKLDDKLSYIIRLGGTFPESHPNKKGHEIIATDVFLYLKENKFMRCLDN